jgi:hypothetical protein
MCSKRTIAIIGVIVLSFTVIALIYSIFSGESLNWFTWSVVFLLSLAATLIGFDLINIDQNAAAIKESFKVKGISWIDNLKQGVYYLLLGLFLSILGVMVLLGFLSESTELMQWLQDVPSPFNLVMFFGYGLLIVAFPVGLYLIFVAIKILVITIRRYKVGDLSFNGQRWTRYNIF